MTGILTYIYLHNTITVSLYQNFFITQLKLELEAVQPIFIQKIAKNKNLYIYELYDYNQDENI